MYFRYVEEYRMSDVEQQLGVDRDNLIELAMLLGSDYTEVGPEGTIDCCPLCHAAGERLHRGGTRGEYES